ncbi:putative membrane protein [Tolypocladium ophioglossoides CBS 100239]|uniref:Putative membrane protein n=1 Tax=Tolypocladium ophioglossoides (strain CBS 100239) TaxID=1163406 RepID=A0A0L0NFL6_TOLOC|nr:putative membrane protein [Tolypocladium ophioglossoides CBS 100239]
MASSNPLRRLATVVWGDWQTNTLWQRILKYSIACTIAVIIAIQPPFKANATFLMPMVTVFAHPGQRMGVMIESLLMILFGSLLGLAWSLLGLYLSSLVDDVNPLASYTIRALFLLVCVLLHGYVRSSSPRLFNFVFFLLVAALLTIQLPSTATASLFTTIYIPILLGGGVLLVVNLAIFPELSSSYLGSSTINTLSETVDTLTRATHWFVTPGGDVEEAKDQQPRFGAALTNKSSRGTLQHGKRRRKGHVRKFVSEFPNPFHTPTSQSGFAAVPPHLTTLAHLTEQKPKLRKQLSRCQAAQDEVNFEISISSLPPMAMKPISTQYMTGMVQNIITLIGACENKFVVVGKDDNTDESPTDKEGQDLLVIPRPAAEPPQLTPTKKKSHLNKVDSVKPVKEIEASSAQLLESILARIQDPVQEFQGSLNDAVSLVISCLAYCFDVPTLPSGASTPKGVPLEEIDLRIDQFIDSLTLFDTRSAEELKRATMDQTGQSVDFMPRMETFLISSFILAFRDSAAQVLEMLRHARYLVDKRQRRHDRSRLWMPQYTSIRQWLSTGGESDAMALPKKATKATRTGKDGRAVAASTQNEGLPSSSEQLSKQAADEESSIGQNRNGERQESEKPVEPRRRPRRKSNATNTGWLARTRAKAADIIEWAQDSDDLDYALKLAIAVFIVTWPAFVASWNAWYSDVRGVWAPMQLILVFEVAIGTSLFMFAVRLFGVVFGCVVGYLANEIGRGNGIAVVVILLFGVVPSVYIQVATKYVKAGMISIVSMAVVALAAVNASSTAYGVFYKRLVAFLVGGLVAMLVEIAIAPVRARDRLVESLSASVRQIQKMQAALAVGIDRPEHPNIRSHTLLARFNHARDKAQGTLAAAETFLPFCLSEPRLKGSFKPITPVYREIIYVLHQIIDRMDNVVQLRRAYGSSILEDLNHDVHAYRRDVAAGSTLILFSVNEALTTWLPLPQFIPSARLAQLRLINRVRDIVMSNSGGSKPDLVKNREAKTKLDEETADLITKRKFLSWNASTAGQMEIIEYLEELVELVKLLVGVNAFRSGMLERPKYRQYIRQVETNQEPMAKVRSTRSGTSAPADEHGHSTLASAQDPRAGPSLSRAATVSQQAGKSRESHAQKDGPADDDTASEDEDGGLPRSLQRVGTRLRQDNTVVRRRAFTFGGRRA